MRHVTRRRQRRHFNALTR